MVVPRPLYRRHRQRKLAAAIASYSTREVTHNYGGHELHICIADRLAEGWYDHDMLAPPGVPFLQEHGVLVPGAKVFDFGAHQGVVALVLAREVTDAGHVVAVEADSHNARIAARNRALNKAANLTVLHAAGSATEGTVRFSEGLNGRVDGHGLEIAARTVDGLARDHGAPDLVFIDVEGYEEQLLMGAGDTLQNGCTTFLVEIHGPETLSAYGASAEAIIRFFSAFDMYVSPNKREPFVALDGVPTGRVFLVALPIGHSRQP